jgi:hypothetical protein
MKRGLSTTNSHVNLLITDKVIEGEAYPEHTAPHANGLLSILHGLLMLKHLRFFRPLQDKSRDLHTTEDKNWLFTTAGREDRGSAQDPACDGLSGRSREAGGDRAVERNP